MHGMAAWNQWQVVTTVAHRLLFLCFTTYAHWDAVIILWLKLFMSFASEMLLEAGAVEKQGIRTEFAF